MTSEIIDAKALNLGAGKVGVYLILASETGDRRFCQAFTSALNAQDVRPLTDTVTVQKAKEKPYA